MRVLQIIPSIAASRGGPTYVVLRLARALARAGVSSAILATRADLDADGEREARLTAGEEVSIELVGTVGPARLEFAPAFVPALLDRLRGVDLVHVHTVFTYPVAIAPLLCRALRIPYVVRPAGTLDSVCLALRSTRQKRLALALGCRRNLVRAGAIQVTSAREAEEVGALVPAARVSIVELGVDLLSPSSSSSGDGAPRRLGFLGRLHPIKGLEPLFRTLALLPADVELALAGTGDPGYVESLRALAGSLGVGPRVHFLGQLAEEAKQQFLRGCHVMVFPSRHESFGVAVAEAMAAGRAVVVSPEVGIAAEIARHRAGEVVAAEPQRLASAVLALLDNAAARAEKGAAGRRLAEARWGWDAVAERTRALYQEILDGPR